MKKEKRKFEAKIVVEVECETLAEGLADAKRLLREKLYGTGRISIKDVKPIHRTRTLKQNAALHLYFTQLAEALNDAGYDMRKTIKPGLDIPWTPEDIKEHIWRPVQISQTGKKSTAKLETIEIDQIYDIVNRAIAERTGVHIPFPNLDLLINQDENNY